MTPDGISTEDWDLVHEAAVGVVNASAIEDDVLYAHHTERLFDLLTELEGRYGRIPAILATRADFTADSQSAISLHEEVLRIARDPVSKRLSLQSLLRLMIEGCYPESQILNRLQQLEEVTEIDGDPSDVEELGELRADFQRTKTTQPNADTRRSADA